MQQQVNRLQEEVLAAGNAKASLEDPQEERVIIKSMTHTVMQ